MSWAVIKKFLLFFSIVLFITLSAGGYFIYQKLTINKKIEQAKQELQQIEQEIEKTKKFNEEEYAEKVSRALDFESYFSTSTDIQLEGVEIIDKGDRKLVINHTEGYQIEIPKELILNQSKDTKALHFDNLELIKFGAPVRDWTVISIYVWTPDDGEIYNEELESIKNSITATTTGEGVERDGITTFKTMSVPSKISINSYDFYKVNNYKKYDSGGDWFLESTLYITFKDKKIIKIIAHEALEKYIETFKFLE